MAKLNQPAKFTIFMQQNKWLGQPATAQGVIPSSAGLLKPSAAPNQIDLIRYNIQNNTGSSAVVALVGFLPDSYWEAGQVNAAGALTLDTTDAQDGDTNDFALETTTQNDGHLIGADCKFGAISYDVTTAGVGTSPTHVFEYWNGSAWASVAAAGMLIDVPRSTDWAVGEQLVMFATPPDWAKGGSGTGVNANRYNIRVRRTNATQTTAALARRIYVGLVLDAARGVANNASLSYNGPSSLEVPYAVGAIFCAYSAANSGNLMSVSYNFV